jgi:tetratricopeptide (TPR) repeat protein
MTSKKKITTAEMGTQVEEDILLYQQRLTAKPDSHAFLPLAKAYCKAGRYAAAIETCVEGLEKYPDYWAARVVLAQAYLGQDMLDEALIQLEQVVQDVDNNLLASRLLGQIYIKQGQLDKVIARYKHILNHHPECTDLEDDIQYWKREKKHRNEKAVRKLEEWLKKIKNYRTRAA